MNRPKNSDLDVRLDCDACRFPSRRLWRSAPASDTASESHPALFHEKLPIIYANIRV